MPSFDEIKAKLQAWAASFLGSKAKLYEARKIIDSLLSKAQSTGYVEFGGNRYSLEEVQDMKQENDNLLNEYNPLEKKFLDALDEMKRLQAVEFPVIDGIAAAPVAIIAWVAGATVLIGTIVYFMSRVKDHLNRLAGATAAGILSVGTIAAIAGGGYLLWKFFGKKNG